MKLYYLPLEPLTERYTEQWLRWFPKEFEKAGYQVEIILGERLTDTVEVGTFLDLYSSMHWFFTQLASTVKILSTHKEPCAIFIPDIEMWGVEGLKYLQVLDNLPVKLYGFCHATSITTEDFMSPMSFIGRDLERGWLNCFDAVFVGSKYFKNRLLTTGWGLQTRIIATGNPFNTEEVQCGSSLTKTCNRFYDIIISDRPDQEKRILDSFSIAEKLIISHSITVAATTSRKTYKSNNPEIEREALRLQAEYPDNFYLFSNLRKDAYYGILRNSKCFLSFTIDENFGYSFAEACACGTYPVVPNDFSFQDHLRGNLFSNYHPDLPRLMYYTKDQAEGIVLSLISDGLTNIIKQKDLIDRISVYDKSIERMIEVMNG